MSAALFIRHGKASAFASTDYDQLSAPGVEQSEHLGAWLAEHQLRVDAVFLGPRRRHAQTHEAVCRVLAAQGMTLPDPTLLPELDEHAGLTVVQKLLPTLAADDPALRHVAEAVARGEAPAQEDIVKAFKAVTRRWALGELGHADVESWAAFRARTVKALPRIAEIGRGKTALVFTSAGVVASAAANALGVTDEEKVLGLSWSLYNGSISELNFADARWWLRTFNATPHLRNARLITSV